MLESIASDLRIALRRLRKSPVFTAVAVGTLALGIGAGTAIFSLADAALLRTLPVSQPETLAAVYTTCRSGFPRCSSSYPDFLDYRSRSTLFGDMAAYSWTSVSLGGDQLPARLLPAHLVSGNFFQLLGLRPAAGRLIGPEDDNEGSPVMAAVISYRLWRNTFGSGQEAIGEPISLNGVPFTIVGVAPKDYQGLALGRGPEIYIPLHAGSQLNYGAVSQPGIFQSRRSRWIAGLVGRLEPGATVLQARQEMTAISDQLALEDPRSRGPRGVTVDPASSYALPFDRESDFRRFVALLIGVVAITLLLAWANLSGLLLARGADRLRENGLRLCLGADRRRLLRQHLAESLVLATAAGAASLLTARWFLALLSEYELPGGISIESLPAQIDLRVLALTATVSLAAGVVLGILPAIQAARLDPVASLRSGGSGRTSGRTGLRKGLLAVQVAICILLLVGSGLFLRTLREGLSVDLGFDSGNLTLARFNLSALRYTPEQAAAFLDRLVEGVESLPEVSSASVSSRVPLQIGGSRGTFITVPGYEPGPDEEMEVEYLSVSPGYFRTLGLPLSWGQEFSSADGRSDSVAIINRTLAGRYWQESDAGNQRFSVGGREFEVIGVAHDTTWRGLDDPPTSFVYVPMWVSPETAANRFITLAVRSQGDPERSAELIRDQFRQLEPRLALSETDSMRGQLERLLRPQRMGAFLFSCFAALALILAVLGIFGIVHYTVAKSDREIGIRLALGARNGQVLRRAMLSALRPALAGGILGLAASVAASRLAEGFLFAIGPRDPLTYLGACAALALAATAAAFLPARRAAKVDPMRVLRSD